MNGGSECSKEAAPRAVLEMTFLRVGVCSVKGGAGLEVGVRPRVRLEALSRCWL